MDPGTDATTELRPVREEDHGLLRPFFEEAWGSGGDSTATPSRDSLTGEGASPPAWVFIRDGRAIGFLGTLPVTFVFEGENARQAHWLKGFWVLPEFRNGPVGFLLLKAAMKGLGLVGVSTVALPARRLFESAGLMDLGVLFNRLRILRPSRVLSRVRVDRIPLTAERKWLRWSVFALQRRGIQPMVGAGLRGVTRAWIALRGGWSETLETREGWDEVTSSDLDGVWNAVEGSLRASARRDGAAVLGNYGARPGYRIMTAWDGRRCVGWAVLKEPAGPPDPRLDGLRVACLSDLLFPPGRRGVGLALLEAVDELGFRIDLDAIVCSGSHPALEDVLRRRGYARIPGNVHMMLRTSEAPGAPTDLGDWWLTRGDARSDGAF